MSKRKQAAPADVDFADDQISELRAAYDFYGATNDQLKKDDLRSIMGKLNLPVNNDVLQKMIAEGDLAGAGFLDFTAFMTMMSKKMKKSDNEATVSGAFAVFDPRGNGEINSDELYKALTTMGDKLSEAEWEEVANVADKDGVFAYREFVKEMFGARVGNAQ